MNLILQTVPREAFTYLDGQKEFVQIDHNDLYPYLLVNIGSGVSMIKVYYGFGFFSDHLFSKYSNNGSYSLARSLCRSMEMESMRE